MKNLFLLFITFYQHFFSDMLRLLLGYQAICRYPITCSEYAKIAIARHGVAQGSYFFMKRFLTCQPWYKGGVSL